MTENELLQKARQEVERKPNQKDLERTIKQLIKRYQEEKNTPGALSITLRDIMYYIEKYYEGENSVCSCKSTNYGYGYAKCYDCGKIKVLK